MSHLIATSRGRHNGASTVINGAQLPPQRRPFTLCHHSRPSLPGSLMALELPFIPLSPQPLSPVPLFSSLFFLGGRGGAKPGGQALLSRGVGPDLCAPVAGDSPPLCFGPLSPLPRQIRARPGHGEREPPGVSLSSHSHQRRAARSGHQTLPYSHTHTRTLSGGQCPHKVTAPIGRGMRVNQGASKTVIFDCQAPFSPSSIIFTQQCGRLTVKPVYCNVKPVI